MLQWSSFKVALEHFQYDTFTCRLDSLERERVVFALGPDREIVTMSALGVEFKRAKP